jgi:hypothetical protein
MNEREKQQARTRDRLRKADQNKVSRYTGFATTFFKTSPTSFGALDDSFVGSYMSITDSKGNSSFKMTSHYRDTL